MSFLIENSTSRALFFFFNDTATTEIYTLSLHDALPIYLANRGVKTANVPLVPNMPVPVQLEQLTTPLVVGLYASPERIVQIRQNRLLGLNAHRDDDLYVDRQAVAEEIAFSRKLCAKHNRPIIDVTRRSIEETAAAVMALLTDRRRQAAS